jgi:hypothetical protein
MAENLRVRIRIDGVREHLAACRALPPEAQKLLRTRSQEIAETLAVKLRGAAMSDSPQSALMAPTVKALRDRVPTIQAGGSKRVGRNRKPAYKLIFGTEFGAKTLRQFRPHRGASSYWFFREVEADAPRIEREWKSMADELVRRWSA